MKHFEKVLLGILLICLGVILGLNAFEITNIDIFFDGWWTLFIIVPSFLGLLSDKDKSGHLIGLFIGIVLLLGCQDIIDFSLIWKLAIPFVLVVMGLSIIFKNIFQKQTDHQMKDIYQNSKNISEYNAIFGGKNIQLDNQHFQGATLNSIFGSIELDLRQAYIDKDVIIDATAIFGGIEIKVPEHIHVQLNATSIFGGVDNDHKNTHTQQEITLYINTNCIFGGIDIE